VDGGSIEGLKLHLDDAAPSLPCRVDAGSDRQAVEPGVEPLGVAQPGQVTPGSQQRLLDRVSRELAVPEDQSGGSVQPRDGRASQQGEGLMIASSCQLHELSLVHGHPWSRRSRMVALDRVWRSIGPNRSRRVG
jgi:hypothetical protein